MTTRNISYGTTNSGGGGIDGLTASSTWTTGIQWYVIDNSTDLALDRFQTGDFRWGNGTSSNTSEVRIYVVASYDGSTWPDTVTGVAGNSITFTSQGVRDSVARLAARFVGDSNAFSNTRRWRYNFSVAALYGGIIPNKCVVFFTHNVSGPIDSSNGTNAWYDTPIFETIT